MRSYALPLAAGLALACFATGVGAKDDAPKDIAKVDGVASLGSFSDARSLDLAGRVHVIGDEERVAVLVFLGTECPVANKYLPDLNALAKKNTGVEFYGVISEQGTTRARIVEHAKEFAIDFPVLVDSSGELAARLKPTHTPEAFVVKDGTILYRGRIDDRWEKLGKPRANFAKKDLESAIECALADKPIETPRTEPIGCVYQGPTDGALPAKPTYARDVAPILNQSCVSCHRSGGIAPFALQSFDEAKKHGKTVASVTESRYMPPWHAEVGFGHFQDERRLSDREIKIIDAWVKAEMPEGDAADLPPALTFAAGWHLGEPDLVVKMPKAYEIPASGADQYRAFVLRADIPEDTYVVATEFKPGAPTVVHHCIVYLDTTGTGRAKEEKAGGFGYPSFGGPGFPPTGSLGGWAPGAMPRFLPDGMGRLLKKGSDIIIQMHYHPSGKVEQDQSQLALYFAKKPVQKPVSWLVAGNTKINIDPGDRNYRREASLTLRAPITVIGCTPHMHLIGREMKAIAKLPTGEEIKLINVNDWDFRWQDQYQYKVPLRLPEGTEIQVWARYDNSTDNASNPADPPRRVWYGEQTTNEMCFFFITAAFDSKADQRKARGALFGER
ncbi:MAG: redoxin domain-containing protein [Planctomycetota bacterium]